MGSSFSDLDDTSVTQSALEDALLSNIQNGGSIGMGSRMSSLREALGKKYSVCALALSYVVIMSSLQLVNDAL